MNYTAQCLEKFRNLPESIKNTLSGLEVLEIIETLEERYNIQLGFLVILIAIGELSLDMVPEYLEKKYNFSEEDAFDLQSDLTRDVFSLLLIGTSEEASVSITAVKEIFTKGIVNLLKNDAEANKFNHDIFSLFSKDGSLQEALSKEFLVNQERLTAGHLLQEERELAPTIANWLKDFIKTNGSEMFDELVLAQYLSTSQNAKKLNVEDKSLLRRVIRLYRNLSFFPESMENLALADWQIIPVDQKNVVLSGERDVLSDDYTNTKTVAKPAAAKPRIITKAVSSEEKIESTSLDELQQALTEYTPGSLGYKAVTQEIERLKKKK